MQKPTFDPSVSFGNLLSIGTMVAVVAMAISKQNSVVDLLGKQVEQNREISSLHNNLIHDLQVVNATEGRDLAYIKEMVTEIRTEQKALAAKIRTAGRIISGPMVATPPSPSILDAPWPDFKIVPN